MKLTYKQFFIIFLFIFLIGLEKGWALGCHGGGGGETTVLPSGQKYQFGLTTSYRFIQGYFDSYGWYTPQPKDSVLNSLTTLWNGGMRLNSFWQFSWALPLIYNKQVYSEKKHSAISFGDAVLEARHTFWEDVRFLAYQPELNFYGGVRLPLGTSVYNSTDTYGETITGEGVVILHGGISAAKLVRPLRLTLNGTFYYPWQKKITQMRDVFVALPYLFKNGNRIFLEETLSYLINNHWSSSLGIRNLWLLKSTMGQKTVDGSAGRLFSTVISLGYAYDISRSVALNYETLFPFYKYAVNQAHFQTMSLALQYGIF